MIRNTQDFIDTLKFGAGIMTIVTVGLAGVALTEALKRRKRYHRPYNPETFDEVSGRVKKVSMSAEDQQSAKGVILTLATDNGDVPVHLGPTWFINHQFDRFKNDEIITVGGSREHYHGRNILVASALTRGNERFRLRDKKGRPYWQAKITWK